ncbi:hypothetical protein SRHO_G00165580 [Serrasalmus rhombeus]
MPRLSYGAPLGGTTRTWSGGRHGDSWRHGDRRGKREQEWGGDDRGYYGKVLERCLIHQGQEHLPLSSRRGSRWFTVWRIRRSLRSELTRAAETLMKRLYQTLKTTLDTITGNKAQTRRAFTLQTASGNIQLTFFKRGAHRARVDYLHSLQQNSQRLRVAVSIPASDAPGQSDHSLSALKYKPKVSKLAD